MSYYLAKRYFFPVDNSGTCAPFWVKAPHWNPVRYETWGDAAEAYMQTRLGNVLALGVPGYPAADLDIIFEEDGHEPDRDQGSPGAAGGPHQEGEVVLVPDGPAPLVEAVRSTRRGRGQARVPKMRGVRGS